MQGVNSLRKAVAVVRATEGERWASYTNTDQQRGHDQQ
jgi:hypothetical protein